MQIPAELRRRPPERALDWVASLAGPSARVVRVRRLRNAWASAVHAVDLDAGQTRLRFVLRRYVRTDLPPDAGIVANEAAALTLLESRDGVVAPRLVGADPSGAATDVPALVMTRLPGHDVLAPPDLPPYLDRLAATLRAAHAVTIGPGPLAEYRPWNLDTVTAPPPWTNRAGVWERAVEIANRPVPAHRRGLVHRDFHPGNVLWRRGAVTGVVDWAHACRGPAAADVAHCRLNLAILFGIGAAEDFAASYGESPELAWFEVADAVSMGGAREPEAWRWHDAGRTDITQPVLVERIDDFLARAVSRAG